MILIGISGKKGVGKDLLALFLKQKYGFVNIPFAGELKESVRRDFDLTKEHTDGFRKEKVTDFIKSGKALSESSYGHWTPREIMIAYGQFFRQFDPLWWVKKTFDKIKTVDAMSGLSAMGNMHSRFTISDVRFKNEANFIKDNFGYLIRLERKPELNIYKAPSTDISETDLDNYTGFDFKLDAESNITPGDLSKFANGVMENILQKQTAIDHGFMA